MSYHLIQWDEAVGAACKVCNLRRNRRLSMDDRFELAEWVLAYLGYDGSTFGVEYARAADDVDSTGCWYLNTGDTYDLTVCYAGDGAAFDHNGDFFGSSWGDVYEDAERRYCEENNCVRCGYCGAYAEIPEGVDWSDARCESCGRNVSTGDVMPEPADDDGEDDDNE